MSAEGLSGIQIEYAKKKALEILDAYPPQSSFMLVSSEAKRQDLFFKSKDDIYTALSQLKTSAFAQTLNQAYKAIQSVLETDSKATRHVYILSDFQKKDFEISGFKADDAKLFLVSLPVKQQTNIYLDTAYFLSPLHSVFEDEQLVYRVQNTSLEAVPDFSVEFLINDTLKSISTVNLPEQGYVMDTIVYKNTSNGIKACELRINDLPITFDNRLFLSYKIKQKIQVAILSDGSDDSYLYAFFKNNAFFDTKFYTSKTLDLNVWSNSDVLIANQLKNWPQGLLDKTVDLIEKGKHLLYFSSDSNKDINQLFDLSLSEADTTWHQIAQINYESSLLEKAFVKKEKQVNLPSVDAKQYIKSAFNWLLKDKKGQALVARSDKGLGSVLVFTMPMNKANQAFYTHPVFIPLMYNFMTQSQLRTLYYYSGISKTAHQNITSFQQDDVIHIKNPSTDFIPEQYKEDGGIKYFLSPTLDAGHYKIQFKEENIDALAMNYQRKESISDFYQADDLAQINHSEWLNVEDFNSQTISNSIESIMSLWMYALFLALFFMLIEILLIKWWRKV
jgi:hypothetical protein